jgi:hypothetical protein
MQSDDKSFFIRQFEQRSSTLGGQIVDTAGNLHTIAGQLRKDQLAGGAADLAESGADFIERMGRYLQQSDYDRIMSDVAAFSSQNPWTVAAAGVVLGLVASRTIKATAARRRNLSSGISSPASDRFGNGETSGATSAA